TPGASIGFTSANDAPMPGDWRGISIDARAKASLSNCDIGFAGIANEQGLRISSSQVTIANSAIHDGAGLGIRLDNRGNAPTLDGVTFADNAGPAILLNTWEYSPSYRNLVMHGNHPDGVAVAGGNGGIDASWAPAGYPYFVLGSIGIGNNATL